MGGALNQRQTQLTELIRANQGYASLTDAYEKEIRDLTVAAELIVGAQRSA